MENECNICFYPFDKTSKVPRLLTCGHTFCHSCLLNLKGAASLIICPNCREKTTHIYDITLLTENKKVWDSF